MDKQVPATNGQNGQLEPGLSIRMGPVTEMDVDGSATNGLTNGKRKSRASINGGKTYKEASSSDEDDKPLVRHPLATCAPFTCADAVHRASGARLHHPRPLPRLTRS